MKRTFQILLLTAIVGGSILLGFVAGNALSGSMRPAEASAAWPPPPAPAAAVASPSGTAAKAPSGSVPTVTLPDFADIVEHVSPAVVSISSTKFSERGRGPGGRFFEDPFEFFFGPGRPERPGPRGDQPQREDSGGTGFLITPDGYILTNYHVIESAEQVSVRLNTGGDEYTAKTVGTDPATDVALIKIEADHDLPYLSLGDSDRLRVGEWVMAIGNPFFYQDTVTVGVVSAKGRKLDGLSRDPSLDNYIQTDAAINMGNSGGPLLNLRGEVVGINTAISRIGQGIGFAIPVNIAKGILPQLRESGRVARGAIGVSVSDIRQLPVEEREYFGLRGVTGALVQQVTEGQPAAKAGIKAGDAIVAIDGKSLDSSDGLIDEISSKRPGESVELSVLRDGKKRTFTLRLEDRQKMYESASARREEEPGEREAPVYRQIGVSVEDVSPTTRRAFSLPADTHGVVITDVAVRGEAYDKGLRPGMVILEVNRQSVNSVEEYRQALEAVEPGALLTLYVQQNGQQRSFVTFRVGARQ